MKFTNISILILTFLAWISLYATPAVAADIVTLYDIEIFQDIITENDFLAIAPYNVDLDTTPDEDIDETFIFSILSPDGSTTNGSALAYPRYNGGYGKGIVTFYFESGMTWGASYIFRIQENPTYYPSPQKWDFSIGSSAYSGDADQTLALRAKIIDSATELTTEWSVDLLSSSDAGQTVLSTYGELYFLNAVPGLQVMCPALFSVQIETPDYTPRSWSYTIAEYMRTKYTGTILGDFMTGFAGMFSMEQNSAMNIFSFVVFVIVIIISALKFKATQMAAFIDGYDVLLLLMLNGAFDMVIAGMLAWFSTVLGGIILFLNRG